MYMELSEKVMFEIASLECLKGVSSNCSKESGCKIHIAPFSRPHIIISANRKCKILFIYKYFEGWKMNWEEIKY